MVTATQSAQKNLHHTSTVAASDVTRMDVSMINKMIAMPVECEMKPFETDDWVELCEGATIRNPSTGEIIHSNMLQDLQVAEVKMLHVTNHDETISRVWVFSTYEFSFLFVADCFQKIETGAF